MTNIGKPGTAGIAARDMHFFWIVDCSGSMQIDGKMAALNNAVKEAIPAMRDVAEENPFAKMLIRVIAFSSGATWTVAAPVPVADFNWMDLQADGVTDMGSAFEKVADQLETEKLGARGFPPVLVLISDGQPTDDWKKGLKKILDT
ncbi:MAG: VWA domain-containing protein, partial [Planctomycetes bacterium]|nr:VWA domain-containing protein [Planctomycetota bacterium]